MVWNWAEDKIGVAFYFLLYFVIIGVIVGVFVGGKIEAILFYALIGPVIAIGPPTINYLYDERLKKPVIQLGDKIEYSVAPLEVKPDVGVNPVNGVIPTVYFKLGIENKGKATAQNCMVNVDIEENGDHVARWKVPENPERYDLLPGETRSIHLFRAIINWVEPLVQYPQKITPESKGSSSFGGWRGQKTNYNICTITVQAIAADYKSNTNNYGTLQLREKAVEVCSDEDNWQTQWTGGDDGIPLFDGAKDLVKETCSACSNWLEEN